MTIADRLRTWLGALHAFRTARYLAKHAKPKAGAQTTKEAQR